MVSKNKRSCHTHQKPGSSLIWGKSKVFPWWRPSYYSSLWLYCYWFFSCCSITRCSSCDMGPNLLAQKAMQWLKTDSSVHKHSPRHRASRPPALWCPSTQELDQKGQFIAVTHHTQLLHSWMQLRTPEDSLAPQQGKQSAPVTDSPASSGQHHLLQLEMGRYKLHTHTSQHYRLNLPSLPVCWSPVLWTPAHTTMLQLHLSAQQDSCSLLPDLARAAMRVKRHRVGTVQAQEWLRVEKAYSSSPSALQRML